MKKLVLLISVLSLVLIGCATGDSTPNATVTKTVTAYPEVEDSTKKPSSKKSDPVGDELYILLIRENADYAYMFTDNELFQMGKDLCTKLDRGTTVREFVADVVDEFYDDDDAITFIATVTGVAIAHYCPEYEYQLN
jgi:hypothetical protein